MKIIFNINDLKLTCIEKSLFDKMPNFQDLIKQIFVQLIIIFSYMTLSFSRVWKLIHLCFLVNQDRIVLN